MIQSLPGKYNDLIVKHTYKIRFEIRKFRNQVRISQLFIGFCFNFTRTKYNDLIVKHTYKISLEIRKLEIR